MNMLANIVNGAPAEIDGTKPHYFTGADGEYFTDVPAMLSVWTEEMRLAIGVFRIVDDPDPPAGKIASSWTFEKVGNIIKRHWNVTDAPIVMPPAARTLKTDIWRRCTTAEAEMLDRALDQAPAQLRRVFDAATIIEHDAPEFPALRDGIAVALGGDYTRADELLAASVSANVIGS